MTENRYLSSTPPEATGNPANDTQEIIRYLQSSQEELNFILRQIYNRLRNGGE